MQTALILLPVTTYILLTLIFSQNASVRLKFDNPLIGILDALVKGHIVLFAFIAVSTEILSLFNGISFPALLAAWLLLLFVCFVSVYRLLKKHGFSLPVFHGITPLTAILVGSIVFIISTTFSAAIFYPPNNWDSMTYHMPRVAHWISNNNISYYPTEISAQNYQMPLAEFAIMHVQILAGCDIYANLVQWVSFLVLICLGFLIAGELGLSKRQQFISAIVVATLPMAILQASSTQNDLVVSSFLMSFGLFMLRLRDKLSSENVLIASISLGLALMTKGTAFLYGAAIGMSLAVPVVMGCKYDLRRFLKATVTLSLVVFIALLLNTGHFWRSYHLYGHPLSTGGERYSNENITAATFMSNILRNGALHLGTPYNQINRYQFSALKVVLGSELNNPKTTWKGESFRIPYSRHEDTAGNLIHMLIALFGVVLLLVTWGRGYFTKVIWYAVGILLGAVLYCLILKWQPWNSRLHTPLFALAAPLMAIIITADLGRVRKCMSYVIILCMVLYSLPFALANESRSLVSLEWNRDDRMKLYFINRKNLFDDYKSAMNILGDADNDEVGLYLDEDEDDWEYPFWAFAGRKEKNGKTMTFRHVGVNNVSGTTKENMKLPTYVIAATKSITTWEHGQKYTSVYSSDHVSVFRKSGHNNDLHRTAIP